MTTSTTCVGALGGSGAAEKDSGLGNSAGRVLAGDGTRIDRVSVSVTVSGFSFGCSSETGSACLEDE